jgi:hypothetical protein
MVAVDIWLHGEASRAGAMTRASDLLREVVADPDAVAQRLLAADEPATRALAQAIERRLTTGSLDHLERVWDLSASQAASLFGVSRQAYAKWRVAGIPAERRADVAEISAITSALLNQVKVDRIPAVVRRDAEALGGVSIIELVRRDPRAARLAVEAMLDLRRVQP